MEKNSANLLADIIKSITQEELALCQANADNQLCDGGRHGERRTMIAYDELVN